jgi:heme exporter protein A
VLTIENLEFIRNDQILFSSVNFTLNSGEVLHISGANGCGKSTLLNILVGLLKPETGLVKWRGVPIQNCLSEYRAQLVYIGHKIGVKNNLTVQENLDLVTRLSKPMPDFSWQPILQTLNLNSLQNKLCAHLSAGQRQRIALARLLIRKAGLWVLDEPFTAIDADTMLLLQKLINRHLEQGGMTLLTSHQSFMLANVKQLQL